VKAVLYPEEIALCLLARHLGRPVKWVEQRREAMQASAHAREHRYEVRAGFDAAGRLLADGRGTPRATPARTRSTRGRRASRR
jgi:carbon-monoxide dehydrogenase large subunit